ncbi:MAG: hypothetical protein QOG00_229 [Pyrinomonadaceae bacterium]|nr:hypothetical protein [Pyrinomonadaceae bacterium]
MAKNNEEFFDEMTEQSQAKVAIVRKYFWIWAKIMAEQVIKTPIKRIAYADLFAGPGRYEDGTKSTPLLVLEAAIRDPLLRQTLVGVFNDADEDNALALSEEVDKLPGIETLKYKPRVWNYKIGMQTVEQFEKAKELPPTLMFIDPWGYKGLSLRLVKAVIRHWGCECIFFFNYKRVNAGLDNPLFLQNMIDLFGEERARELPVKLKGLSPFKRESAIVNELTQALQEAGGKYVIPFCFKNDTGSRTSHHLIFVTKNIHGYSLMKKTMASESSQAEEGVASFTYCPADKMYPLLYGYSRPIDDLTGMLLERFAGQSLTMRQIYEAHHVGTPYIDKNYKDALRRLEEQGKVATQPPPDKRRRQSGVLSFGDNVLVTFPD